MSTDGFLQTINLRIDIALFQLSIHSNMSLTFMLTGKSSLLLFDIDLNDYELSLTDFETYHTIFNVNSLNNKFYFDEDDKENVIPKKIRGINI